MTINEDGESGVPINTTKGVVGPVLPIKFKNVARRTLNTAFKLKTKKLVERHLDIKADVLFCSDTNESLFLN